MKKVVLLSLLVLIVAALAAVNTPVNPNSPGYDAYKNSLVSAKSVVAQPAYTDNQTKDVMNMLIPLDATFTLALSANDDGYVGPIALPWTFSLYDTPYTSFYINNNGNVTFDAGYDTFTSTGFPVNGYPMIAGFWADVDTRGTGSGLVYYRIETNPNRVVVIWDNVGYYQMATDKLNTFEIIFTDGSDPLIGLGNNVVLSYGDMQWTTGTASDGVGGFGGTAATVGINKGADGIYTQAGRFDQPGILYDGEVGLNDGVDWLDDRDLYLDATDAYTLYVLPAVTLDITAGIGLPGTLQITDPTLWAYQATYTGVGLQTVTIPVGAGVWRGWIYYTGDWHEADVFPVTGPGNIVFSNVPFGAKADVPVIIDMEDATLPVELSSFTAAMTSEYFVNLAWVTQSETEVLGFNVLRNDTTDPASAVMLNSTIIPATNTSSTNEYSLTDNQVETGHTYYYWLQSVDLNGSSDLFGPQSVYVHSNVAPVLPEATILGNASPNPFNAQTNFNVSVKENETATLSIYNSRGQLVSTTNYNAGEYIHTFRANNNPSGVYFYKLSTPTSSVTKKMLIVR